MKDDVTIAKCPNPECDPADYTDEDDFGVFETTWPITGGKEWHVECDCGYQGPRADTSDEAIRLHNLLCRPAEDGLARDLAEKLADEIILKQQLIREAAIDCSLAKWRDELIMSVSSHLGRRSPPLEPFERLVEELSQEAQKFEDADNTIQTQIADRIEWILKSARGTKT